MTEEAPRDEGRPVRRRASRAAGPAGNTESALESPAAPVGAVKVSAAVARPAKARAASSVAPPPRRPSHRGLVALVASVVLLVFGGLLAGGIFWMKSTQSGQEAVLARDQQFVDTAQQLVVNMFSYTQNDIDQSVDRFVDSTSGPLRDMLSQDNNVDNLKAIFRDTNASSEAVINGAALESIDEISSNAAVLVSVRVTVTDMDGTNKPSQPYRLRVIVHEDDNGHMTGYDLKYPDGGN
ncbi:mammalian cell entry protein [Mycobacterium sp. 236(2023)]|uniref:mammalian cell entry protein n=1 Tax=Mycobacterium sp. 236(2023) TaxID=3038163 RepID=UPI002414D552|nr:mammalian cell entry protein [Mycobacterium sp. 236(2023)]MDG4665453.1 mammalian cell entry protein [Mycobacterium sp. 236(2023)]